MTIAFGRPWRFIAFLMNFNAAALSRVLVTKDSNTALDSPPEVAHLAVDLHVDLVETPMPMGELAHVLDPLSADLAGEHRAEPVSPQPHGLVTNVDAALEQQVLDVAQGQGETDLKHDHQPDHLGRGVEPAKRVVGFLLAGHPARLNSIPYGPVHLR